VKVTLDINVLLDVFQKREPHYAASAQVVSLVTAGSLAGVCPAHGLTTLYYLVRKHASKPDAEDAMDQVLRHFQIGNLETAEWQEARRLPLADFEDAVGRPWPRQQCRFSSSRGMWRTLLVRPCPRLHLRIS